MIGYLLEQELGNVLPFETPLATILTMIEVDPADPAFNDPTKFVGPVYEEAEARALADGEGLGGQAGRREVPAGRRVATSAADLRDPADPLAARAGHGRDLRRRWRHPDDVRPGQGAHAGRRGGRHRQGPRERLLARELGADVFIMATDVDGVYDGWGTPDQRRLPELKAERRVDARLRRRVDGPEGRRRGRVRDGDGQAGGDRVAGPDRRARGRDRRHERGGLRSTGQRQETRHMGTFGVHSEVGKLRRVIVHRPDLSLKRLTPGNHDELLFDDVLWVERAQWEHDQFVARMRERGVEVLYVQDLLAEALAASDEARRRLIELVGSRWSSGRACRRPSTRACRGLARKLLARHLIGGLTVAESGLDVAQAQGHVADRGRGRRPVDVRPAAAAQQPVHPRLVVLDLRRRLGQPDVLARPPARGLQHGRDLPRPSAVRGRATSSSGTRRWATTTGSGSRTSAWPRSRAATSRSSAAARSRSACRERTTGADDRADREGAVRQGRRRARHRRAS